MATKRRTNFLFLASFAALPLLSGCAVTPKPLTSNELTVSALGYADRIANDQYPVTGPIDLYEAMARALKFNLDHRVEIVQAALRQSELDLSHYSLLPNVVANTGFAKRDSYNASSSLNLVTGKPNFGSSTSQEKNIQTSDVAFSWSILDFGLSYIRARQAADKVLIAEEARRKAVHQLIGDVRTAYWRAISSERLLAKARSLEARADRARRNSSRIVDEGQSGPIAALTYERELVEIKRTLQELQRDLSIAKTQLAALMSLKPGTHFKLVALNGRGRLPGLSMKPDEMIETALRMRSELRENSYSKRINSHEAHAALLELLPGFQLYAGTNYDSNAFLLNSHWLGWGAKASWNLLKVFSYPARRDVVEMQDKLLDQRALALSLAIMTQVHISRARYLDFRQEVATAADHASVQKKLLRNMRIAADGENISEQTLIREELNTLVSSLRLDIAYANSQNAYANVFAAMGLDPIEETEAIAGEIPELAATLRHIWRERGDPGAVGRHRLASSRH